MEEKKCINLFIAFLMAFSFFGCAKESEEPNPQSELLIGWWHLQAVYEGGNNVTAKYRTINEWVGIDYFGDSYIEIVEEDVNLNEDTYFQYFIVGFFEEGTDANYNKGKWEVKGDMLTLYGNSGKLEAKITKLDSEVLYLEIEDDGKKVEYRFSL